VSLNGQMRFVALTDEDAHGDYDHSNGCAIQEPTTHSIESNSSAPEKFDTLGFASYLAPYALAAVVSLAVTAAFIKLVLMSY
jgi:hypothetical protein